MRRPSREVHRSDSQQARCGCGRWRGRRRAVRYGGVLKRKNGRSSSTGDKCEGDQEGEGRDDLGLSNGSSVTRSQRLLAETYTGLHLYA